MFNIYSILFGISFNHKFNFIGDLYLSQILIIITSLFFFIKKKNYLITDKIIQKIMILGFLWLLAAIISDYINSSSFRNYSRGLSKIIVTILSFYVFYNLHKTIKNSLIKLITSIVIFKIIYILFDLNSFQKLLFLWKMGLGVSLTVLVILYFCSKKNTNKLLPIILILISMLSLYLQTRYLFLVCFSTAFFVLINKKNPSILNSNLKIFTSLFLLMISSIIIFNIFLKFNFIPDDLIIKTKLQSGKYGFLIGGRFDLLPAIWSITDAPFFGNGSWGENCFYNLKLENFLFQNFYSYNISDFETNCSIKGHSVILEAWSNHGIFGFIFWLYLFFLLIINSKFNFDHNNNFHPLLIFYSILVLWNLFLSPYGGNRMIELPLQMTLLIFFKNLTKKI